MSQIKKHLKKKFIQIFICIAIFEFIGIWQKSTEYFWEYRYLFYSQDALRDIQPGLWTYQPNQNIRFVVSYALPSSYSWIEYDCEFNTNSLGLIDTNYNDNDTANWLVLGDSFTEGHGGCPWLTRRSIQESTINNSTIINGGLQGSGILGFEKLLLLLEAKKINIENVILIAISNDFKRGLTPANIWSDRKDCLINFKCTKDDSWWSINKNAAPDSIISTTKIRASANNQKSEWLAVLSYYSFTYRTFKKLYDGIFKRTTATNKPNSEIYNQNFLALQRIHLRYPNMKLMLVPMRDEVGISGHKNLDTVAVENFLYSNFIPFSTCQLDIRDYMPIDGHPNSRGYTKLFKCVENILNSN